MDVISHWFWGLGITRGRLRWWVAGMMGVLPDLLVFVPATIFRTLSGEGRVKIDETTTTADMGWYPWEAYQITHSLVWMTLGFLLIWWWFARRGVHQSWFDGKVNARTAAFLMCIPWLLHILIDIPTHAGSFFPTPFLAPISDFIIDGVRWSNPAVFFTNVALLITLWAVIFWKERQVRVQSQLSGV